MRALLFVFIAMLSPMALSYEALNRTLHSFETDEGGERDIVLPKKITEEDFKLGILETSHDWLSRYMDDVSYGVDGFMIDTFFGDDILDDDVSGSRAKISFFTRREIGKPVDYNYGVSVKLVLPNTNERFSVLLESSEDAEDNRDNNPVDTVEKAEYSTALRFILRESELWRVSFDNGIKWALPPDPFSRLRFRRLAYFDSFHARFTQTFEWSASDGFGEESKFELNRPLNVDRLVRFGGSAKYLVKNDYFELSYGLSLFHELNKKEVLAYYLRVGGEARDEINFNNYGIGTRYRRMIYQDWIFVEVSPELETASSNHYDITPIIMFRFEALVGS